MLLSEQLQMAVHPVPPTQEGLLVKLLRLSHSTYPGREANGVLPLVVIGHEKLGEADWRRWVRENAIAAYGPAQAERYAKGGVDIKEMLPTAGFGRAMAEAERKASSSGGHRYIARRIGGLDGAQGVVVMVEKWPSLYNQIAEELAEEEMTLGEFVDRVRAMPAPQGIGGRQYTTLGDLIGRSIHVLPRV